MTLRRPLSVFVPFEYVGGDPPWKKRDDLPRFKEPEEAATYLTSNPTVSMRDGKPVFLQWRESADYEHVKEYLRGVGTPEWLTLNRKH